MFFIIGISERRKELRHHQMVICDRCGAYGRYVVFMTYTCLSLFFIPFLKWNRQYFVQTTCCHTIYRLDPEIGRQIAKGEDVEIRPQNLNIIQEGHYGRYRKCKNCGYETEEDFEYCPKCGRRF